MPTFAPIDHAARIATLQRMLGAGDLGVDVLLFVDLVDVRWLTGFTGSNGWVVVRADECVLGTDTRYGDRAVAETEGSGTEIVALQHRPDLHVALIGAAGSGEVGVDGGSLTHARWRQLAADLELVSITSPVGTAREVKDAAEIERIEAAAAAADAALAEVEPLLFGADHRSRHPRRARIPDASSWG